VGIVALAVTSAFVESDPYLYTARLALSLFYQGALVAGFAFTANMWLLQRYLPSHITVIFLSQPIFGVIFSWLVLGEPLEALVFLGAALVIVGSWLARRAPRPSPVRGTAA
jgi:drug/metabolite transporter (DMT)-like permease